MNEELLEIIYNGERTIVNLHSRFFQLAYPAEANRELRREVLFDFRTINLPNRYHLIIDEGVEHVPHLALQLVQTGVNPQTDIKKITMANSVKTLGDRAFGMFANLEEVVWSENLETIGERAMAGCESLGKVFGPTNFLPPTCRLIGPHAFESTECLDMIIIPEHALVHPSAFHNSKMWDSSPINKDANSRKLINWIKNNQHDDYPIHAMFAKTQINPKDILHELCNNDEYLSSFACNKLHKDKDRYGLTPMDYLHRNPYVDETKFDELKLVKASITFNIDNIR